MVRSNKIKIFLLYFFLLAGGLWHILNVFQILMSMLAGPLLIGLGIWLYYEIQKNITPKYVNKFNIWAIIVLVFSFIIETIGVKTGVIFGVYNYGDILWPQIMSVPIAIGFAWFSMLVCSIALMQRFPIIKTSDIWIQIFTISILMTFFDFMMEPAAIKLNYWSWYSVTVPLQNYLAWFILSFILLVMGLRMDITKLKLPIVVMHAYFAQLIFFTMIMFK